MKLYAGPLLVLAFLASVTRAQNWSRVTEWPNDHIRIFQQADGSLLDVHTIFTGESARLRTLSYCGNAQSTHQVSPGLFRSTPLDAAMLPGGDLLIAGSRRLVDPANPGSIPLLWIGRVNAQTGEKVWHWTLDLERYEVQRLAIVGDAVFAAGNRSPQLGYFVLKLDLKGNLEWMQEVDWPSASDNSGVVTGISPTSSGGAAVLFRSFTRKSHVHAFDALGQLQWQGFYENLAGESLRMTENGELWVAGLVDFEYLGAMALDGTGQVLWAIRDDGDKLATFRPASILTEPGGGALISSSRQPSTSTSYPSLMSLGADGSLQWSRTYVLDPPTNDPAPLQMAYEVISTGERGLLLAGATIGPAGNDERTYLISMASDGTVGLPCVTEDDDPAVLIQPLLPGVEVPPPLTITPVSLRPSAVVIPSQPISGTTWLRACGAPCTTTFTNFGSALAGSGSIAPQLSGTAGACLGAPFPRIELTQGLGGAVGCFGCSIGMGNWPLFGGTIYLNQAGLIPLTIVLDGAPGRTGSGNWSMSLESGLTNFIGRPLVAQAVLRDPGAPFGWSITQGLMIAVQ